jgi:hypothetical protein
VEQLKQLNSIKVDVKKGNIKNIVKDPTQYALDFIEETFIKNFPTAIKSYKLGDKFSKNLLKNGE